MKNSNAVEIQDMEDFFSENGAEAFSAMTEIVTAQQNIAFNLTKLIVKHGKSKSEVFNTYIEALNLLKNQMED